MTGQLGDKSRTRSTSFLFPCTNMIIWKQINFKVETTNWWFDAANTITDRPFIFKHKYLYRLIVPLQNKNYKLTARRDPLPTDCSSVMLEFYRLRSVAELVLWCSELKPCIIWNKLRESDIAHLVLEIDVWLRTWLNHCYSSLSINF